MPSGSPSPHLPLRGLFCTPPHHWPPLCACLYQITVNAAARTWAKSPQKRGLFVFFSNLSLWVVHRASCLTSLLMQRCGGEERPYRSLTSPHGGTQRLQSVGKPPNPAVATEAWLLFVLRADDEVSGNSPVATNSTKHSTGEYPSLKMCIVFLSALLKIKSTSQHEGYSFFDSLCQERWSYLREENIPTSTSSRANCLLLFLTSGLLLWVYVLILPEWALKHRSGDAVTQPRAPCS